MKEKFPEGKDVDVVGLYKVITLKKFEAQRSSLYPGRYVEVPDRAPDEFEFSERLEELKKELEILNVEALLESER
jgi:type I restriction enzyme M protein